MRPQSHHEMGAYIVIDISHISIACCCGESWCVAVVDLGVLVISVAY